MTEVPVVRTTNKPEGSYVGPYWFIKDDSGRVRLIAHRCALAEAEEYGEFLTCPHGHYEIWEQWRADSPGDPIAAVVRDSEYEEWPRGRVVFHSVQNQFTVYADRRISQDELQLVLGHFGIPAGRVVFMKDAHYQSTRSLHAYKGR